MASATASSRGGRRSSPRALRPRSLVTPASEVTLPTSHNHGNVAGATCASSPQRCRNTSRVRLISRRSDSLPAPGFWAGSPGSTRRPSGLAWRPCAGSGYAACGGRPMGDEPGAPLPERGSGGSEGGALRSSLSESPSASARRARGRRPGAARKGGSRAVRRVSGALTSKEGGAANREPDPRPGHASRVADERAASIRTRAALSPPSMQWA